MLVVNDTIRIADEELEWTYARSGGPGGQNVNKVASKAVMRWGFDASLSVPPHIKARFRAKFGSRITTEGDFILTSQRYRDQERNRQDCLEKFAAMLQAAATIPLPRQATKPSKASKRRRVADKRQNSETKATRRKPAVDD